MKKLLKMSRSEAASDLCGRVRTVDAARMLANLVRRSGYAGLQLELDKRIVTASEGQFLSRVSILCYCEKRRRLQKLQKR